MNLVNISKNILTYDYVLFSIMTRNVLQLGDETDVRAMKDWSTRTESGDLAPVADDDDEIDDDADEDAAVPTR